MALNASGTAPGLTVPAGNENVPAPPFDGGVGKVGIQDKDLYSRLPYYLTKLACTYFPQWQIWNKLYGTIPWRANQGNVMRGVRHEPTPIAQSLVFPKATYDPHPNKNVYELFEMSEEAVVHMHDFESKIFHFQPEFTNFLQSVQEHYTDITRQVGVYADLFTRTQLWGRARQLYIPGEKGTDKGGLKTAATTGYTTMVDDTVAVPVLTPTTMGKNKTAFLDQLVADVEGGGVLGLTLASLDDAVAILREDINVPFFEGAVNVPRNNEVIAGKYVLVCSSEVFQMFKWDPHFSTFRDCNFDYLSNGFRGSIFNEIVCHIEQFPLRIFKDGASSPVIVGAGTQGDGPQIYADEANLPGAETDDHSKTSLGYPAKRVTTRIAPSYRDAQYEIAWLLGADAAKTIRVGPPPSAFTGKMSKKKFYNMSWNGEVELTDQVLIKYADGSYDTNVYGRYCKYIASLAMACIPNNAYAMLPIVFKRRRPPSASPAVTAVQQSVGSDPAATAVGTYTPTP